MLIHYAIGQNRRKWGDQTKEIVIILIPTSKEEIERNAKVGNPHISTLAETGAEIVLTF
jgi:hypothetical protein